MSSISWSPGHNGSQFDFHIGSNLRVGASAVISGDLTVNGAIECAAIKQPCRGLFPDPDSLRETFPRPFDGEWALVGQSDPFEVYSAQGRRWNPTGGSASVSVSVVRHEYDQTAACQYSSVFPTVRDNAATALAQSGSALQALQDLNDQLDSLLESFDSISSDIQKLDGQLENCQNAVAIAFDHADSALDAAEEVCIPFNGLTDEDAGYIGDGTSARAAIAVRFNTVLGWFEGTVIEAGVHRVVKQWDGAERFNVYADGADPTPRPNRLFRAGNSLYFSTTSTLIPISSLL